MFSRFMPRLLAAALQWDLTLFVIHRNPKELLRVGIFQDIDLPLLSVNYCFSLGG